MELTRLIWLAGLGAFAKIEEEGGKLFEGLVKEVSDSKNIPGRWPMIPSKTSRIKSRKSKRRLSTPWIDWKKCLKIKWLTSEPTGGSYQ